MSLGLGRAARRRERRRRFLQWLPVALGIVALGVFSYVSGSELAEHEVRKLRDKINRLTDSLNDRQAENARLKAETETAQSREAEWRERYEKEVPTGATRELLSLIRAQLEKGVAPDRLAFMVNAAANTSKCDAQTITKRFLVRTVIAGGASDTVSFANNAITVSADGRPATNSMGNPEAWFDPAQPVTVRFAQIGGGKSTHTSGVLPLHHKLVMNDVEYRFSIVRGERRGFLNVTAGRCPLTKRNARSSSRR